MPNIIDLNKKQRKQNEKIAGYFSNQVISGVTKDAKQAEKNLRTYKSADTKDNRKIRIPLEANNDAKLQHELWNIGAFKGIKNKKGQELTYQQAVDGSFGKMSQQALENAQNSGYSVDRQRGTIAKKQINSSSSSGLANMREMTHSARTGGMNNIFTTSSNTKKPNNHPIHMLGRDLIRANANRISRLFTGEPAFSTDTIKVLPESQTEALKQLIKSTGKRQGEFTAKDWKNFQGNYTGGNRSMAERVENPYGQIEHTLGQFPYYRDSEGNTIVEDVYDFNVDEGSPNQGWYTPVRKLMGILGSRNTEPNEGKIVYKVNLGKLN